eukprot:1137755-Pelagomonas_calceolata.AAC.4
MPQPLDPQTVIYIEWQTPLLVGYAYGQLSKGSTSAAICLLPGPTSWAPSGKFSSQSWSNRSRQRPDFIKVCLPIRIGFFQGGMSPNILCWPDRGMHTYGEMESGADQHPLCQRKGTKKEIWVQNV